MKKLHLGCGKRFLPGFIHVDLADYPHVDYKHDIRDLSIFSDNSVDLIYCSHALAYFDRDEVKDVLVEWRRVLKTNGVLRLATDDFEAIVKVYLRYKDIEKLLGALYGKITIENIDGKKTIYQKTTYDFKSLKILLESTGFRNVKRYDWRKTIHKDYDDYSQAYIPHLCKETGILLSLNVEAQK